MDYFAFALLLINLLLIGGVFYILAYRKGTALSRSAPPSAKRPGAEASMVVELREELRRVRILASELERKRIELDGHERALRQRRLKLDEIIKGAEETAVRIEGIFEGHKADECYARALRMLKTGTTADEVVERLGLLRGEVELMSALTSYRA